MLAASNVKKGNVIEINGNAHIVEKVHAQSPSARGGNTLYKVRTRDIVTSQKIDHSWKGDDKFQEANVTRREIEFSYIDGSNYAFMDLEDYNQFEMHEDEVGDDRNFLLEGMELKALLIDGAVKAIELPDVVELKVIETAPGMKSASATSRTKPAKLETGFEVQVPEYLEQDEVVKVDTRSGEFLSRA